MFMRPFGTLFFLLKLVGDLVSDAGLLQVRRLSELPAQQSSMHVRCAYSTMSTILSSALPQLSPVS